MRKKYYIKEFFGDPSAGNWYDLGLYANEREVFPKNGDNIEIDVKKEQGQEFERYYMEKEVVIYHGNTSDDFTYLANKIFTTATKDMPRIFSIHVFENDKWSVYWSGLIKVQNVDFYRKEITIKCDVVDEFSRFINDTKLERSIYEVTPYAINLPQPSWVEFYHKLVLTSTHNAPSTPDVGTGYVAFKIYDCDIPSGDPNYFTGVFYAWSFYYAREAIMYPEGSTPDGNGWEILDEANDQGQVKWVRSYIYEWPDLQNYPIVFHDGCENGAPEPPEGTDYLLVYSRCPALDQYQIYSAWVPLSICSGKTSFRSIETNRGRKIYDVLQFFASQYSLDFQSQFFSATTDPVTLESPSTAYLATIIQATDFKYPASDDPATNIKITWEKLMQNLEMFQVKWTIIGNTLIVEHLKWFENKGSYTGSPAIGTTLISGKNKYNQAYSINDQDLYRFESLAFPVADGEDFIGVNIEYTSPRVNLVQSETKDINSEFYTDIEYINFNRSALPDESLVLLAIQYIDQYGYYIISETGQLSGETILNGPYSVANLMNRYWKYRRIFPKGKLNNILITFETWQKNALQENLIIDDCSTVVDPKKYIRTRLGDGEFESMNIKLKTGFKRLSVKLDI